MSVCLCVCLQAWHFHSTQPYDVLDHTNHIFSESLSSGDDIGQDKDLQKDKYKDKDTQTQTKTNTKCFQDPIYAIFFISRGFKDLKYYIGYLLVMTKTKTKTWFYALLGLNIFQGWILSRSEYLSGVNIFQGWIFFRGDYFSGVNIFPGWIFFRSGFFSGGNIFHGWIFLGVIIFQGWIFFRGD